MNFKLLKTVVSSITHSPTAWNSLGQRNLTPGSRVTLPLHTIMNEAHTIRVVVTAASGIKDTAVAAMSKEEVASTATTLTLTHQDFKGEPGREKLYNHFRIQPPLDKNMPVGYINWRNEHMASFAVKVGSSKEEIVEMLEDMVADSQCDGTWAGEGRVA